MTSTNCTIQNKIFHRQIFKSSQIFRLFYWVFKYSQEVTHPRTNFARPSLTSVIRREPAISWWYGRRQEDQPEEDRSDDAKCLKLLASVSERRRSSDNQRIPPLEDSVRQDGWASCDIRNLLKGHKGHKCLQNAEQSAEIIPETNLRLYSCCVLPTLLATSTNCLPSTPRTFEESYEFSGPRPSPTNIFSTAAARSA